jgi:hypothetical protein
MAEEGSDDDFQPMIDDRSAELASQSEEEEEEEEEQEEEEQQKRRAKRRRPARKQGQKKKPCIGGVGCVGASGQLRSLGKFGAGMLERCAGCGGGPHQAMIQAPDSDIEHFFTECIQGQVIKQRLDEWLGEKYADGASNWGNNSGQVLTPDSHMTATVAVTSA